ncbi:MAG: hypothetical protein L3J59_12080 [Methylococcaceae bacterium]|nr:hypothetical protein [Methylococcaceae bacterium]
MKPSLNARLTASGIHFIASLSLFSLLLFIVFKLWFPQPFFSSSGGWQGLKIIALVDLVLGPLITLAIYNIEKPKKLLAQDLSIIVIIQLAALVYGVYTVHSQRPAALAFYESKFYTIPAQAFANQDLDLAFLSELSDHKPAIIYVDKPITIEGINAMVDVLKKHNISPTQQVNLYRPFKTNFAAISKHSINISDIVSRNSDMAEQLQVLLKQTNTKQSENYYLVLESKYQNVILVFSNKAELIGYLKAPYKRGL